MITLAIDTSTSRGSVALLAASEFLLEENFLAERSHTASLFGLLEKARSLTDRIDLVAVGLGPGSYAGVRIAISAALGFQLGLGSELVGLPSIAALDCERPEYLAIGDARRGSFYFSHVRDGLCLAGPELMSQPELEAALELHAELPLFSSETIPAFPSACFALPCASRLARLAQAGKGVTQRHELEPIYLREPHITLPKAR